MTPVSVIVVSRGRPDLLKRCLIAIGQLWHPAFEVIVVADTAGQAAVQEMGWRDRVILAGCDEPNISLARNIGLAQASGDIVAFIDDDAVPEPTWLAHLCAPFDDPEVIQTGGFVRARNGIAFQWPVRAVNALGDTRILPSLNGEPFTPATRRGEAVKTEGTNMALRRDVITRLGGFDPAFRFYLDETDVNYRLRDRKTVIVPHAQVHHGFAKSAQRKANRGVSDLTEIGASTAVFLRKHVPSADLKSAEKRLYSSQKRRLIRHMVDGLISPDSIRPLLDTLQSGFDAGVERSIDDLPPIIRLRDAFKPFETSSTGRSRFLAGRPWNRRRLAAAAKSAVQNGDVATVLRFSPTALSHRIVFSSEGYWEQAGGLFGRSDRGEPWFRYRTFGARVQKEQARLSKLRTE